MTMLFEWLKAVDASELPKAAHRLVATLVLRMDSTTGKIRPFTQAEIGDHVDASRRTIQRWLEAYVDAKLLNLTQTKTGNIYIASLPDASPVSHRDASNLSPCVTSVTSGCVTSVTWDASPVSHEMRQICHPPTTPYNVPASFSALISASPPTPKVKTPTPEPSQDSNAAVVFEEKDLKTATRERWFEALDGVPLPKGQTSDLPKQLLERLCNAPEHVRSEVFEALPTCSRNPRALASHILKSPKSKPKQQPRSSTAMIDFPSGPPRDSDLAFMKRLRAQFDDDAECRGVA